MKNLIPLSVMITIFSANYYFSCNSKLNNFVNIVSSQIDGEVLSLHKSKTYIIIQLNNLKNLKLDLESNNLLENAKEGDRLKKERYSSEVILVKANNNTSYRYRIGLNNNLCKF